MLAAELSLTLLLDPPFRSTNGDVCESPLNGETCFKIEGAEDTRNVSRSWRVFESVGGVKIME